MRSLVRPVRIMSSRNIAVSCDSFGPFDPGRKMTWDASSRSLPLASSRSAMWSTSSSRRRTKANAGSNDLADRPVASLATVSNNCDGVETHRQQNMFCQHKAGRRGKPRFASGREDQRRRHIERAVLDLQPACRFDLAELVPRRYAQAECLFDGRSLLVAWIDEIDPGALRQRRFGTIEREGA